MQTLSANLWLDRTAADINNIQSECLADDTNQPSMEVPCKDPGLQLSSPCPEQDMEEHLIKELQRSIRLPNKTAHASPEQQ